MILKHSKRECPRSALFVSISTLIILIGGSVTMLWQLNLAQSSQAASSSVVGPPSLSAATVDNIFRRVGSPMVGAGKIIEQTSRETNIDDAFALGVWWTETNDGEAGVGLADRNPGSVRGSPGYPAAFDGYTIYPSYKAAVIDWFNILRSRYVNRGLFSVYAICRPYVGTSSAPLWAAKVVNLMTRYQGEAPPPVPTVVVTPTRPSLLERNHRSSRAVDLLPVATGVPTSSTTRPVYASAAIKKPLAEALPISKTLPVGVGLLSALIIGLWGLKIRKRGLPVPEISAAWQADDAVPAYPPLYINEFSPVLERQTSPILYEIAEQRTGQIACSDFSRIEQLSFPDVSPWIPETSQVPEPVTSGAGLLSRYHNSERLLPGVVRLPAYSDSEPLMSNREEHDPTTETLSLRGMGLPGRHPEPVGARVSGGGLLSRYGNDR